MCGSARFLRCAPCSSHLIAKHRDGDSEKTHLEVLEPEGHIMLAISPPPSLNSIQVNRTKRIFYFCCQDVNISCFCFFNAQVHGGVHVQISSFFVCFVNCRSIYVDHIQKHGCS